MNTNHYMLIFMQVLGSLALLMYGMKAMSEALQKMAGSQLRHILGAMTTNRFTGIIISHHSDDSELCKCRTSHPCTSHLRYYGCQHRYYADSLDYVVRLSCWSYHCHLSSLFLRHPSYFQSAKKICWRLPVWYCLSFLLSRTLERCRKQARLIS